jgi:hypothetical protein
MLLGLLAPVSDPSVVFPPRALRPLTSGEKGDAGIAPSAVTRPPSITFVETVSPLAELPFDIEGWSGNADKLDGGLSGDSPPATALPPPASTRFPDDDDPVGEDTSSGSSCGTGDGFDGDGDDKRTAVPASTVLLDEGDNGDGRTATWVGSGTSNGSR